MITAGIGFIFIMGALAVVAGALCYKTIKVAFEDGSSDKE